MSSTNPARKKLSGRDSDLPSEEKTYELEDVGLNLRPGQRVTHRVFGPGIVKRIEGKGDKAVATVDFFGSGVKKILASFFAD